MLSSIILDVLLLVILLTMIPLGFLRGGLRELCTASGILFGILLAHEWSQRWGDWLASRLDLDPGGTRFLVAVFIILMTAGFLGYGGSAAFSYQPGPGGRMYGAYIALLNGIIFIGYLTNAVVDFVYDGSAPPMIEEGIIARALSIGFGWVLLLGMFGIIVGTVFGMFVRERPGAGVVPVQGSYAPQLQHTQHGMTAHRSVQEPPQTQSPQTDEIEAAPSGPVRIKEVRHWEESPETSRTQHEYGSGWRQTWPDPRKQGPQPSWEQQPAPKPSSPKRAIGGSQHDKNDPANPRDVLRDWMKDEGSRDSS